MKKILYIAIKYHDGNPKLGYSFEHSNFYDSLENMAALGYKTVYFPIDEVMNRLGRAGMNNFLLATADKEKPDLCFFSLIADEIKKETISSLTNGGHPTLSWFGDDYWRFDSFTRFYAPLFSWVVTTDPHAREKYFKIGYSNAIYLPSAANPHIFRPVSSDKSIDVSFVGSWNKERGKIIKAVQSSGVDVVVRGSGWPAGRASPEELVEIISKSKISLSLNPSSSNVTFRSLARLFFKRVSYERSWHSIRPDFWNFLSNLREWRQKSIPTLKAKTFEVPACRTLTITKPVHKLETCYELGQEIVTYRDTPDLIEKIKYYLEHDQERELISQAGYLRTLKDHTYENRFNYIFEKIGLSNH